jgi:hypothetical protein
MDYPWDDFAADFDAITEGLHATEPGAWERSVLYIRDHMRAKYSPKDAAKRSMAFTLLMMYLSNRLPAFDHADYLVYGSERVGALVSRHLLKALHHAFVQQPGDIRVDPTPAELMALADTFRQPQRPRDSSTS